VGTHGDFVISFVGIENFVLDCSSLHHMVLCNGVSYVINLGLGLQPFIFTLWTFKAQKWNNELKSFTFIMFYFDQLSIGINRWLLKSLCYMLKFLTRLLKMMWCVIFYVNCHVNMMIDALTIESQITLTNCSHGMLHVCFADSAYVFLI
jgi:hypothetical protein